MFKSSGISLFIGTNFSDSGLLTANYFDDVSALRSSDELPNGKIVAAAHTLNI